MTTATRPFFAERKRIVELAGKYRLPAIYSQKEFVDEGGLMSYGADYDDLYRRAAVYVDKILKGAKPADLPVQQATKFEFVINLKAAKQIGLTIPVRRARAGESSDQDDILDFRLPIFDYGENPHANEKFRRPILQFCSDNLDSKIENPKCWQSSLSCSQFANGPSHIENLKSLGLGDLFRARACWGCGSAQQPKKVPRIGYLSASDPASESTRSEAIRLALRERGYIEGQNIAIEYRYAEGKRDRFPELAAELVRLKVDIIVVAGGDHAGPGGQECDQDDSHRYGGRWGSILSRQA